MGKTSKYVLKIAAVGVMSALVFAASNVSINLFTLLGGTTRIHLGNIMCLLSGLLFGGILGGLSAGIGSCFFDLFNPLYISSAPFTFAFKFLMGFICGAISHKGQASGQNLKMNIIGGICGQLAYILLYLSKSFIESVLVGNAPLTALADTGVKGAVSLVNAIIAVSVSVPLAFAIIKPLKNTGFYRLINDFEAN